MKTFTDPYRGDGWFAAKRTKFGTFLFAVRRSWNFYAAKPPGKPGYWRVYIGPFEFEYSS